MTKVGVLGVNADVMGHRPFIASKEPFVSASASNGLRGKYAVPSQWQTGMLPLKDPALTAVAYRATRMLRAGYKRALYQVVLGGDLSEPESFVPAASSPAWILSVAPSAKEFTAVIEDEDETVEATFRKSDVDPAFHDLIAPGGLLKVLYGTRSSSRPFKLVGPDDDDDELTQPEVVKDLLDEARWGRMFGHWSSWHDTSEA
jgi:hypothetical protein